VAFWQVWLDTGNRPCGHLSLCPLW